MSRAGAPGPDGQAAVADETADGSTAPEADADAPADAQARLGSLSLLALGVVYGDIGTSPLYAVRESLRGGREIALQPANVLGVLSLITWSLTIVISVKYIAYVLRASNRGEGGILALMALALTRLASPRRRTLVVTLGLFGAALLYGDGMITPAISVLSAVEGLSVAAPRLHGFVVPITVLILVGLFSLQRRGTAGVGRLFGPVTLLWFSVLAVLGIVQIAHVPGVLRALSPTYAVQFFLDNGVEGFLALGAIFLVVTGGEALYADMGHFGVRPIRLTWFAVVLPALLLSYFGQGALLLHNPRAIENTFFHMAPDWARVPLVVLATAATIIASQAVISGAFSLTRQAVMLGYLPRVKIEHTSPTHIGQIYVPVVNWGLLAATLLLVLGFGSSSALAAAYGIAVSTTMIITVALAFVVTRRRWGWSWLAALAVTIPLFAIDLTFFGANLFKAAEGGWVPISVAVGVLVVMLTWQRGRAIVGDLFAKRVVPLAQLYERMEAEHAARVPGTALFLTGSLVGTPPALMQNFRLNGVVHERVVLLTIMTEEVSHVPDDERVEVTELEHGFVRVVAHYGFMENPDVRALLDREDTPTPPIEHTTFFLGREVIVTFRRHHMAPWRAALFSFLSRNAARATAFYNVPSDRVFEVGTQIEL